MYNIMVERGFNIEYVSKFEHCVQYCGEGGWDNRGKWKSEQTQQAEVKGKAKNKMAVMVKSIPGYL